MTKSLYACAPAPSIISISGSARASPGIKLPHINGSDVAGEIAAIGDYITDLKIGQRVLLAPMTFCGHCASCTAGEQNLCRQFTVLGYANDGGNAELIAVPRVNVVPIPDS